MSSAPVSGVSTPKIKFAVSVRPEPSRPAMPTTSPTFSVRSIGSSRLFTAQPLRFDQPLLAFFLFDS